MWLASVNSYRDILGSIPSRDLKPSQRIAIFEQRQFDTCVHIMNRVVKDMESVGQIYDKHPKWPQVFILLWHFKRLFSNMYLTFPPDTQTDLLDLDEPMRMAVDLAWREEGVKWNVSGLLQQTQKQFFDFTGEVLSYSDDFEELSQDHEILFARPIVFLQQYLDTYTRYNIYEAMLNAYRPLPQSLPPELVDMVVDVAVAGRKVHGMPGTLPKSKAPGTSFEGFAGEPDNQHCFDTAIQAWKMVKEKRCD